MRYLAAVLLSFSFLTGFAQDGYEIKVTLKPFKNQYIYLGHYYGKTLPIIDSVKLDAKSTGVFKGTKKLGGGIYLVGYPDRSGNFEILIDRNQHFSIIADTSGIQNVSFVNSPENVKFKQYQKYMTTNGRAMDSLLALRSEAKGKDSIRLTAQVEELNKKIRKYRTDIMNASPNSLMSVLMKGMKEPEVPYDAPEAKTDSLFAYHYFKNHYWDGVYFFDDRLARTPFFESRIDKYFEQLVYPSADSVIKEMDYMLGYASASEEMQKFLLLKFVNRYLNQKYMWEDAVFVHLYEKYFSQKNYPWLSEKGKKVITDRAYSLMANITGTQAANIELPDTAGKMTQLSDVQSPFTIVAIWDPMCGHCKEVIPHLDSAYHARWKGMGVKFFAMAKETEGKKSDWLKFINEHHLNDWIHVYYSKADEATRVNNGIPGYTQLYDVQSFPTLYLLDKDKRIIAKKITLEQIDDILNLKVKNQ
jgi:hypothetical protein